MERTIQVRIDRVTFRALKAFITAVEEAEKKRVIANGKQRTTALQNGQLPLLEDDSEKGQDGSAT